jgi:hypothetical protein
MPHNAADLPEPARRPPFQPSWGNLAADIAVPWLTVQLMERLWHAPPLEALAAAALYPALSIILSWLRKRRIDVVGVAVLMAILGGILVAFLTHEPRFAALKAAPFFALFGAACLLSLAAPRPLMFFVAREFAAGGDAARRAEWNARLEIPQFRRGMRRLTAVWGIATLVGAALGIAAAFLLPISVTLVVEPMIGAGIVAGLLLWTAGFARRGEARLRQAQDALAEEA